MGSELEAPVAFGAAQAYLKSIEPAFAQLEEAVRRRNSGGKDSITQNPGEIAPVVTGIAFAIELFLKVLQIQELGDAQKGHDLLPLWKPLSAATRARIETRYEAALAAWVQKGGLPFVSIVTNGTNSTFSPAPSATCAAALERLGKAFEKWRYSYELMRSGGRMLYFNFAEANAVVSAVREEILNYPGNVVVSMKRNTPETGT